MTDLFNGMDSHTSLLRKIPLFLVLTGASLLLIVVLSVTFFPAIGQHGKFIASELVARGVFGHFVEVYGQAWIQVQAKAKDIRRADEENTKLRLINSHLLTSLEAVRFDCQANSGATQTHTNETKLRTETGNSTGRILAGMSYKVPSHLPPSQLYTLGAAYLKAHEDEKAAVIFTTLLNLKKDHRYRTAKNLLMTGVAWYHLENFSLADQFFDDTLNSPENPETVEYQAQAKLWKALVAKKLHKELKSQFWLRELIDHHPRSEEASWVNHAEAQSDSESEDH